MDEGVRTLDRRSHNPELYQLSYVHHIREVPAGTLLLTSTLLVRRVRYQSAINEMARPAGLEPATIRLEGGCSIQLSYTPSVTGVAEGSRTPHLRSHNPVLYLMSYGHH